MGMSQRDGMRSCGFAWAALWDILVCFQAEIREAPGGAEAAGSCRTQDAGEGGSVPGGIGAAGRSGRAMLQKAGRRRQLQEGRSAPDSRRRLQEGRSTPDSRRRLQEGRSTPDSL